MIFYINRFIPTRFAGITYCFVILIRPTYRDDVGLLEHEKTHVKQFWRSLGLLPLLYEISKSWRLKLEVEAYRAQAACYADDRMSQFAKFLATKYNLDITEQQALELLLSD
jgi:hypothetical protein